MLIHSERLSKHLILQLILKKLSLLVLKDFIKRRIFRNYFGRKYRYVSSRGEVCLQRTSFLLLSKMIEKV